MINTPPAWKSRGLYFSIPSLILVPHLKEEEKKESRHTLFEV